MSQDDATNAQEFPSLEGEEESETLPPTTAEETWTENQTDESTAKDTYPTEEAEVRASFGGSQKRVSGAAGEKRLSGAGEERKLSEAGDDGSTFRRSMDGAPVDPNADLEPAEGDQFNPEEFFEMNYDEEMVDWGETDEIGGERPSYFNIDDFFDNEEGEEGEPGELEDGEYEDEDTIPKTVLAETDEKDQDTLPKERKPRNEVSEMSKRSFRWFERRVLSQRVPQSDENLRRRRLLEKCQVVRRVSKPVVTILGVTKVFGPKESDAAKKKSRQSVGEGEAEKTFPDYTERAWAMKNTVDFLNNAGCSSSSGKTYNSSLKAVRDEADFRLALYEQQLQRRRRGIGGQHQAPEITAALRRHAERAIWRAVIDNTKPRYPLPRFILPRHLYLKKVQGQFIGPGSYEHGVYDSMVKLRKMQMPSLWASCSSRFPKDPDDPDAGGRKGGSGGASRLVDPWEALEKANDRHRHPGIFVPFESTPCNWRKSYEPGSRIPPNAYNIKSPLEEYVKTKTSLRGPYDCYTPSRGVIPYGYYKTEHDEESRRLGPGLYELRSSLVKEMNDPYNVFKGVLGKASREAMFGFKAAFDNPLWPKENGIPPVGQYDIGDTIGLDKVQNAVPFKTSEGLKKKDVTMDLIAPDYYYYGRSNWSVPPKGADLASVFKSKTPQIMLPKMHHIRKERNRAMNRHCDLEGGIVLKEEHYAWDPSFKNDYVLEDCKDACLKPKGGPVVDPYAIPGYGVDSIVSQGGCCGGCSVGCAGCR